MHVVAVNDGNVAEQLAKFPIHVLVGSANLELHINVVYTIQGIADRGALRAVLVPDSIGQRVIGQALNYVYRSFAQDTHHSLF